MRDDLEPGDRRGYLMAKIEKVMTLAKTVDPTTAQALRQLASELQAELRTYPEGDVKASGRPPDARDS